jgi:choline dehydrogenase
MDAWELDEGAVGWNSETLIPYFNVVEDILKVVYPPNDTQGLVDAIFEASRTAGFPYNPSYNHGPDMLGIANFVMSINDVGKEMKQLGDSAYNRVISYQKYLQTSRPANLHMITGLEAIGFNFSNTQLPVIDHVELYSEKHQCKFSVAVGKELILSAGAINSPKLLQFSGIGNATQLDSLGIKVVKDLPGVGMNLRDDVVVNLVFATDAIEIESPPASFLSAVLFAVDSSTTQQVSYGKGTGSLTNIEMLFSTGNMIGNSWPIDWQNSLVLSPNVQQCKSRGTVMIQNSNPLTQPAIDPAYLSVSTDFDRVINSILLGRQLMSQPSFAKWNFREVLPGPTYQTRDELIEWIRGNAATGFHYIGTCKMGTDSLSVVNPLNMKVWGVEGLRIVDASVAPSSFSANTQSLTYAVTARAADLIVAEYKLKPKSDH